MSDGGGWGRAEDVTLLVLVAFGVFLFAGSAVASTPEPRSPLLARPGALAAVGAGGLLCGVAVVALRRRGVIRPEHVAGGDGRRFWTDTLSFGVTALATSYGFEIVLGVLSVTVDGPVGWAGPLGPLLAVAAGGLVVGLDRRASIRIPAWLRADDWGLTEDVTLFAVVALLTVTYSGAIEGPAGGPLTLLAPVLGAGTVALRRRGVFRLDGRPSGAS